MSNRLYSRDHTTRYPRPLEPLPAAGDTLHSIGEYILLIVLIVAAGMLLSSCGTQVITRGDGTRIVNTYAGSESSLSVAADGTVTMTGNGEKGAELGFRILKTRALIGGAETVIKAVPSAVNAIKN